MLKKIARWVLRKELKAIGYACCMTGEGIDPYPNKIMGHKEAIIHYNMNRYGSQLKDYSVFDSGVERKGSPNPLGKMSGFGVYKVMGLVDLEESLPGKYNFPIADVMDDTNYVSEKGFRVWREKLEKLLHGKLQESNTGYIKV